MIHQKLLLLKTGQFKFRLPAIAGLVVLFLLPSDGLNITICWFKMLFGLPCPACGLTRGMSSLLHFEFYKSFLYHPLSVLVLAYLFILAISNQTDYLKKAVQHLSDKYTYLFSFKFIAILFICLWIFKLFKIYFII